MRGDHSLIVTTLVVSEYSELTQLTGLEDFITSHGRESLKYFTLRCRF
jgi:hypothetical protein